MNLPWKPAKYLDQRGKETVKENPNRGMWASATCTYWTDNFSKVFFVRRGNMDIPVCPECGSVGAISSHATFEAMLLEMEKKGNIGWGTFVLALKETCQGKGKNLLAKYREKFGGSDDEGKYGQIWTAKKNFHPGEPVFLLRGTDPCASLALQQYAIACFNAKCSAEHQDGIKRAIERLEAWQKANPELVKERPD